MSSLERQKNVVKESLCVFVEKYMSSPPLSCIDDIVLSYMTSVLEDLGAEENFEEHFDVEEFVEMMGAYFPGFTDIESSDVCEWFFKLAAQLSNVKCCDSLPESDSLAKHSKPGLEIPCKQRNDSLSSSASSPASPQPFIQLYLTPTSSKPSTNINISHEEQLNSTERFMNLTKTHNSFPANVKQQPAAVQQKEKREFGNNEEGDELEKQVELLQEMFPNVRVLEVAQCLSIAEGDTERAAQLIMHRLENKDMISPTPLQSISKYRNHQDEKQLKEHILSRYAYVDKADDQREHKPVAPKMEPKKLIRYRDNKIVSIKGEKFTEVKKDEDEDPMKKTFVNLKPARQYRFH